MRKIFYLFAFSISFGYIEASVVYYLRLLCYPSGFSFPLNLPSLNILGVEIAREVATIFLLLSVSFFVDKTIKRWGYFCIFFGIWDIFYYIFLFILIKWPTSLFTYDILFLIPVLWVSPVICPLIISFILVFYGFFILKVGFDIKLYERITLFTGLFLIFLSFTFNSFKNPSLFTNKNLTISDFPWILFISGVFLFALHFALLYNKTKKRRR